MIRQVGREPRVEGGPVEDGRGSLAFDRGRSRARRGGSCLPRVTSTLVFDQQRGGEDVPRSRLVDLGRAVGLDMVRIAVDVERRPAPPARDGTEGHLLEPRDRRLFASRQILLAEHQELGLRQHTGGVLPRLKAHQAPPATLAHPALRQHRDGGILERAGQRRVHFSRHRTQHNERGSPPRGGQVLGLEVGGAREEGERPGTLRCAEPVARGVRGRDRRDVEALRKNVERVVWSDGGKEANAEAEPVRRQPRVVGGAAGPDARRRLVEGDVPDRNEVDHGSPLPFRERAAVTAPSAWR